jgi:hypothetical protein
MGGDAREDTTMKPQVIFDPTALESPGRSTVRALGTTADEPSDGRAPDGAIRASCNGTHDDAGGGAAGVVDDVPEPAVDDATRRAVGWLLRLIPDAVLEQIDVLSVSTFAPEVQRAVWARQILDAWGSAHHKDWPLFRGHLFEQVWHDRHNVTHLRSKAWMPPKSTWEGYDVVTIRKGVKPIWVGKGEPIPGTCLPNQVVIVEGQPTPAGVTGHSMKAYREGSSLLQRAQSLAADKVGVDDKVVTTRGTKRCPDPRVVDDPSIGDGYLEGVAGRANGDRAKPTVEEAVAAAREARQSPGRLIGRAAALAALSAGGWQLLVELHQLDEPPTFEDFEAAAKRIGAAAATGVACAAVGVGAAWWVTEAGGAAWAAELLGLTAGHAVPAWLSGAAASGAVFALVLLPIEVWRVATHRSNVAQSGVRLAIALAMFGSSVGALALGLPAWLPAVLLFGAVSVVYVAKHGPVDAARSAVRAGAKVAHGAGHALDAADPVVEAAVDKAVRRMKSAARWATEHIDVVAPAAVAFAAVAIAGLSSSSTGSPTRTKSMLA